jgi:tetratricopeptide (TPR) repeat protein
MGKRRGEIMKPVTVFCRLVSVCIVVSACGHGAGNLDKLFAEGRSDEVLRVSAECLEQNPGDENCLLFRAKALERTRQFGDAIAAWRELLSSHPGNREALDRLLHYTAQVPDPALGLWVRKHASPGNEVPDDESLRLWEESIAIRDSLVRKAAQHASSGILKEAIRLLRQARRYDGGDLSVRQKLCNALLHVSRHGLTLATRTAPLEECRALLEDRYLEPSHRAALEGETRRAHARFDEEMAVYERAASYTPWARAPFIALVDSSSYFPWIRFRCDETHYADIEIEFPPGFGQFVLAEESADVRAGSVVDAPIVATIRGSAGMVVLEKGPSYFLVSSGDEAGWKGWIRRDILREKNRITYELTPRGSVEFRTAVTKARITVDVNGMNFWRGEVDLEPYIRYEWSF